MRVQKGVHREAFVPARSVDVQPNRVATQSTSQVAQRRQKTLAIAVGMAKQCAAAQEGGHPAEEIQPLVVRTSRRDSEPVPTFGPPPPQPRVQREPSLVFEDNGLARGQCGESFFRLSRNRRASVVLACT